MHVAFLFRNISPNLDLDFQVMRAFDNNELNNINTLVRTGIWGLLQSLDDGSQLLQRIIKVFYNGRGNLC